MSIGSRSAHVAATVALLTLPRALRGLSVPARLIASADYPVIPMADLRDGATSAALQISVYPHGGHCAFLEDYRLRSWTDRAVLAEVEDA